MKSFTELRDRYPLFSYHGYHMEETPDEVRFWYDFEIAGLASFQPTWTIEKRFVPKWNERDEVIQKLVFSIGMVELSSYWKITCSPLVEIHAAGLDEESSFIPMGSTFPWMNLCISRHWAIIFPQPEGPIH